VRARAERISDRPTITAHQIRPLIAGFFGIMDRWQVDNAAARVILGEPPERTFYKWKAGEVGAVPMDTIRRIGYVSGIWKALEILYSDPHQADSWIHRPNRFFNGQTPLARMTAGDVTDLAVVRQYLDGARAPW
jgi:hypothetical protein